MLVWGDRCAGVCVMMVCAAGGGEHGRWWRVRSYPRNVRAGGRAAGWCGGGAGCGGGARTRALFVACDKKKLSIPACHSKMLPLRRWDLAAAAAAATR